MSTDYASVDVKCPFYITEEGKKIRCEGLERGCCTVLEFRGKKFKDEVKEKFCTGDYEKCKLYALINKKYE